jgi:acetyl-CoA C-acetyltransferase
MMWEPIRFLESCPSSDGACAVVISDEDGAKKAAAEGRAPAWILGASSRSEPPAFPGRDPVRPEACLTCADDVYRMAGITRPREQLDMAELYVPFSWHEPMWLEAHYLPTWGRAGSWSTTDPPRSVVRCRSTARRACCRPIRSVRPGCCASPRQPTRCVALAGEHQVDGAKTALGMAYGANSQYFSHVGGGEQPAALRLTGCRPVCDEKVEFALGPRTVQVLLGSFAVTGTSVRGRDKREIHNGNHRNREVLQL